ncbi:MAG: 3-phosphoshikimate 1-carboxyvinyltransferase [Bacillota bacterium]|nr:3-phosphoshikimate 1-carboxyvinyltransferase [Bacillota bacterium]
MKSVIITPSSLKGTINIPSSKSLCHRSIIAAGLSNGVSNIDNIIYSDDINATIDGMRAFGVIINKTENGLSIDGSKSILFNDEINDQDEYYIDCIESGSTLRFFIPISALTDKKVTFSGRGRLGERPLDPYYDIFNKQQLKYYNNEGKLPLTVEGRLSPGLFYISGDVSSQFITGLLYALPCLNGDSSIILTTQLESKPYVDMTIDTLKKFSVSVTNNGYKDFFIKGNQSYKPYDCKVEGDFSQAAFWLAAGALGGNIELNDINMDSLQGDKVIVDLLSKMGANIMIKMKSVLIKESVLNGITIDASECPDLVPILAVIGALSKGTTEIINAARLRLKESDRLKAIAVELNKLGADVKEKEDGLLIKGKEKLNGGTVNSWNDHRIAMALAVASIKCTDTVIIEDSEAVKKSYPEFFEDFKKLGGIITN